jgi:hypothetical protein
MRLLGSSVLVKCSAKDAVRFLAVGYRGRPPFEGWSSEGSDASLLVGVPRGVKLPLVDGMVPRKGSAKAPLLGLDEIVSMKWSWGHRGQQERSPDW